MSGDGAGATGSAGWAGHLKDGFLKQPVLVAVLVLLVGLGYLIHSHDDLRAVAVQSFQTLPSGWIVLSIGGLIFAVWHLFREVKACHDERIADREEWEEEKARWINAVRDERDAASEAREQVEFMYQRLVNPRRNTTPVKGGKRHYDPE